MGRPTLIKTLLALGALAIITCCMVIVLRPKLEPKPATTTQSNHPSFTPVPAVTTIALTVDHEKLIAPTSDITVKRGTTLAFQVSSTNTPEEMNIIIPGYNQKSTFSQNSVGNLEFTAGRAGTFDIQLKPEDERTAVTALHLVVAP